MKQNEFNYLIEVSAALESPPEISILRILQT